MEFTIEETPIDFAATKPTLTLCSLPSNALALSLSSIEMQGPNCHPPGEIFFSLSSFGGGTLFDISEA